MKENRRLVLPRISYKKYTLLPFSLDLVAIITGQLETALLLRYSKISSSGTHVSATNVISRNSDVYLEHSEKLALDSIAVAPVR
jgi:hypothetical protein